MPTTEFARMLRSDHSMRPPSPAATIRFKSPNACNGCHTDKTPQWADRWVRQWRGRDYQTAVLHGGDLIEAARRRDWKRLPEMLAAVTDKNRNEVFANSIIRLLRSCDDERIALALPAVMKDPSPLIRASAAESLGLMPTAAGIKALAAATGDDYRLVRIRAAQSLARIPDIRLSEPQALSLKKATEESLAAIMARPDQWSSHYNLGNFHLSQQNYPLAISSYETAIRFDPTEVPPWVNLSMAYARQSETAKADEALRRALALEPHNAEANFNMGLLKAEEKDLLQAEKHLRLAFKSDPQMAQAAYNLCVLLGEKGADEALGFCGHAAELRPREPRYTWTCAYYQNKKGDRAAAVATLETLLSRHPQFTDAYLLLADLYARTGEHRRVEELLNQAVASGSLRPGDRAAIEERLRSSRGERR
jgi:tetratricopeptide (TPR) repeat protein